jgi:cobaltochelatase CobS
MTQSNERLEAIIADPNANQQLKDLAQAELNNRQIMAKAAGGDNAAQLMVALGVMMDSWKKQNPTVVGGGVGVSKQEVEDMLRDILAQTKISMDDLDPELKAKLSGQVKIALTLNTPKATLINQSKETLEAFERPLMQKIVSDMLARNNVYLYGGAGTGKTFIAGQLAEILGYDLITVNCNQFTSSLDLLGGQTIEGYQRGRLEMAWGNYDTDGKPFKGAILLLDELPKIDPNTAGILNEALAKVKDFKPDGRVPQITNGRGQKVDLGNMFVIATGNVKLNETSVEYEANFKQDLSLQDRFSGSTYQIFVDYENEAYKIMKGFAFIWIYMTKMREVIMEERWTGQAFVSIRIMTSMRDTYKVYRGQNRKKLGADELELTNPKTLKQAVDSFLSLFVSEQNINKLKTDTNYDEFLRIVEEKDKLPLDALDTKEELDIVKKMVAENKKFIASKTI